MNRSAAMALFLPLSLVLLLATGGQAAAAADEPSTSRRAVPGPSPPQGYEPPVEGPPAATSRRAVPGPSPPKGYQPPEGPPAATTGGQRHREIKIGPCIPSRNGNALSSRDGCIKRCTDKGYAGGRCDVVSGGFPGDCFCVTLDGRA